MPYYRFSIAAPTIVIDAQSEEEAWSYYEDTQKEAHLNQANSCVSELPKAPFNETILCIVRKNP